MHDKAITPVILLHNDMGASFCYAVLYNRQNYSQMTFTS